MKEFQASVPTVSLRRLPPMHSLAAFEAAARLGAFARAAEELCVTHSAVSHRIRQLEEHLGIRLFVRVHKQVVLTPQGERFLLVVRDTMQRLSSAATSLGDRPPTLLRVSSAPALASHLVGPNLRSFLATEQDIELEIEATVRVVKLGEDGYDVGLRLGDGHWPGFESEYLVEQLAYALASPEYVHEFGSGVGIEGLRTARLIHNRMFSWNDWLKAAGSSLVVSNTGSLVFEEVGAAIDAAVHGMGVVISNRGSALFAEQDGRLVRFVDRGIDLHRHYYAVFSPTSPNLPAIRRFLAWLKPTMQQVFPPAHARA